MKDRARRGEAVQLTEASLIATQKKERGFVPQNGHAGLFFESDLCSCLSFPPATVQTRAEQAVLVMAGRGENVQCHQVAPCQPGKSEGLAPGTACKVFVGVCLCVYCVVHAGMSHWSGCVD